MPLLPRWWLLDIRYSTFSLAVLCLEVRVPYTFAADTFWWQLPQHNEISTPHKHLKGFVHKNVKLDLVLNRRTYYCSGKIQPCLWQKVELTKCVNTKCQNCNKSLHNVFSSFHIITYIVTYTFGYDICSYKVILVFVDLYSI